MDALINSACGGLNQSILGEQGKGDSWAENLHL